MSVKNRLIDYIRLKGISIRQFEISCGLSNGYVNNMRTSLQPEKLVSILKIYPDLNIEWLITGNGFMLKSLDTASNGNTAVVLPNEDLEKYFNLVVEKHANSFRDEVLNDVFSLNEKIKEIAELKKEITRLKRLLSKNNIDDKPENQSCPHVLK